jgi:hypothetical protein
MPFIIIDNYRPSSPSPPLAILHDTRSPSPVAPAVQTLETRDYRPSSSSTSPSSSSSSFNSFSSSSSPFSSSSSSPLYTSASVWEIEYNEELSDESDEENISQIFELVAMIYALMNELIRKRVYSFYSYFVAPIRLIISLFIIRPLFFVYFYRSQDRRSLAQDLVIDEKTDRYSARLTDSLITMIVIYWYWPQLFSIFYIIYHYIYLVLSSAISLFPVYNSSLNQQVQGLQSQYQRQQNHIDNIWFLVDNHNNHIIKLFDKVKQNTNDIQGLHVQSDQIQTVVEKLIRDTNAFSPASIAQGLTSIFDTENKDALVFSPEFLGQIQQNPGLQRLMDTGKLMMDDLILETVKSIIEQKNKSRNYADGRLGAFILYKNTSASLSTEYWHKPLQWIGLSHFYDDPHSTTLSTMHCWTINSKSGSLAIGLSEEIFIKQVVLQMAFGNNNDDISTVVPFEVYSLPTYSIASEDMKFLGRFEYNGSAEETFDLDTMEYARAIILKFLETEAEKTVCRVKVFGDRQSGT